MTSVPSLPPGGNTSVPVSPKSAQDHPTDPAAKPADAPKAKDGGPAFSSPVSTVDPSSGVSIQVYRDSSTGQQISQYPSKQVVDQYAHGSKVAANASKSAAPERANG